jgi:hypothetical protein
LRVGVIQYISSEVITKNLGTLVETHPPGPGRVEKILAKFLGAMHLMECVVNVSIMKHVVCLYLADLLAVTYISIQLVLFTRNRKY